MFSELMSFDEVPRYLLSSDAELRRKALNLLEAEINRREGVRRPWGSIEQFIVALYHKVFVNNDAEAGKLLLNYLNKVMPSVRNTLPPEVQEATDIILYAVQAKLEGIDINMAIKRIQEMRTTTQVSELVKGVTIVELMGKYDESIKTLLNKVTSDTEKKLQYLATLLNDPDFKEIANYFLLDLDMTYAEEPKWVYTIWGYFIKRATELQNIYKERKKIIDKIEAEYQELERKYNEIVESMSNQIKKVLPIVINLVASLLTMPYESIRIYSGIVTFIFIILYILVRQLRDIIINTNVISTIAKSIAEFGVKFIKKEGRELLKQLEIKKAELRDLEDKLKTFR
uniref:Uncharacterized protein n=1 Tax=Ignisphaera aggregans TaxID=334771 RepID=A0A7C4FGH5_9CREN